MKLLPLLFLLLIGCATSQTYEELYDQAAACTSDKAIGCDALWEAVERRDEANDRRKERDGLRCPSNEVSFKDRFGRESCMRREDLSRIFRHLGRW